MQSRPRCRYRPREERKFLYRDTVQMLACGSSRSVGQRAALGTDTGSPRIGVASTQITRSSSPPRMCSTVPLMLELPMQMDCGLQLSAAQARLRNVVGFVSSLAIDGGESALSPRS